MSQFGRTFATAASSFASKRSYAQNIRLPTGAIAAPVAVGSCSTPASPSSALFSLYGGNARAPSQSQVPFAGNPPLPAGISPASQPQMNFWTTSPPRSPSQLHFRINQQAQLPPSPSQMQFNMNNMFTPAAQPQAFFDLNVAFAETEAASQALCGSPASSSRSMSPIAVDNTRVLSAFQPSSTPVVSRKIKREDSKDAKKGLNPFTYYRKTFPARYPYIDAMIPTQMERSRLTGAFWQHESAQVRSQCAQAVYVDRTPAQIERLENIRLQTQEKRRQERVKAGTDKLTGRNALIFGLWRNGVSPAEFAATVDAHDRDYPLPEPARKRRRKIAAPKLDANLLLAAESLSIASSSPQPSVSSLAYSPAATFNPELPSAVLEKQDGWNPLAIMAHGSYEYVPVQHDAVSMEYAEPLSLTLVREPSPTDASAILCTEDVQSQFHAATLYDGLVTDFSSPPYALGSEGNLDAILDAYSFPVPQHPQDRLPTDMDYDFSFAETLPTEEDGLAFDVAYFGSASGSALDA